MFNTVMVCPDVVTPIAVPAAIVIAPVAPLTELTAPPATELST